MRKILFIAVLVLTCGCFAVAQDYSKGEFYAGYQYLHVDVGSSGIDSSWPAGFNFDGTYYFTKNVGLNADFGYNTHSFSGGSSAHTYEFLFGPRFKARYGKLEPFANVGFGLAHTSVQPGGGGSNVSDSAFALALGGGLDVAVAKHFAIRLAEFNYVMTRFATTSPVNPTDQSHQNDFAFGVGVVIR